MSRPSSPLDAASSGTRSKLPQVAVAAAAGAILSSRSRLGGALVLGGLAWLASRRPTAPSFAPPASLDELCVPSAPFLESPQPESMEPASAPNWEDLRSSLQPPPSLFTPPPPVPAAPAPATAPLVDSPLLHAPVFIEVEENAPPSSVPQAILPDTIAIPTTPDPPPGLLAETEPPVQALAPGFVSIQPKAGLHPPAGKPLELPPLDLPSPPPLPPRRTFLEWLRDA